MRAFGPAVHLFIDRFDLALPHGRCRQMIEPLAAEAVADADPKPVDAIEDVQLGQRDSVDAVDLDRLSDQHRVKPATAARPAGYGAEFAAALAEQPARRVFEFGRKRAAANARGIGLVIPNT